MAEIRTLKLNLLADVDQFTRGMKGAKGDIDNLGYKIGAFSRQAAKYFAVAAAAAGAFAIKLGIDSVKSASDLTESMSKVEVIFGDVSGEIVQFSKTAAKNLGLSQKAALDAASTFAVFGKGAGLTGKDLTNFSKDLTTLSSDFASFFNTRPEDAITAIGAALRGESEPIRRYGVLLNDATLKAKAMEMGLYDGTGALDLQAKSLAAYEVILDQTTDAQGDFARTSDNLANQQRILTGQIEDLKAGFGEAILPVMLDLVTFANTRLIPMFKEISDGFVGKSGTEGLTGTALKVAKAMGYDEKTPGNNLGAALRNVAEAMGELLDEIRRTDEEGAPSTLQRLADSLNTIAGAIESVTNAWATFKKATGFQAQVFGIQSGLKGYNPFLGFANGGSVNAGQAVRVGEMGSEVFVPRTDGQIVPNHKLGGGGNTFIFNGVIDGESARRTIEKLLQDSARRSGAINLAGATL
jgi:hypothetical protein